MEQNANYLISKKKKKKNTEVEKNENRQQGEGPFKTENITRTHTAESRSNIPITSMYLNGPDQLKDKN